MFGDLTPLLTTAFTALFGDLTPLLNTALAVIALATLAGIGLMRGDRSSLRERIEDYKQEVEEKDRRLAECDARRTADKETIVALRQQVKTLEGLKSGEALFAKTDEKLDRIISLIQEVGR